MQYFFSLMEEIAKKIKSRKLLKRKIEDTFDIDPISEDDEPGKF